MTASHIDTERISAETFVADVELHSTLESTNDRALQCAAQRNYPMPLLIVAAKQTAGRGRGGNRWWTGKGSLAMSLLVESGRLAGKKRTPSPLTAIATALAVVDTVAPLLDGHAIGIRWPNDVLVDGHKLAGILIEATTDGKLVIGIGLNTNNSMADAPDELTLSATTLLDLTGRHHDQTELLLRLLLCLERLLDETVDNPRQVASRANDLCSQRGEQLSLAYGNRTITGRCAGIAPDGALLLDTPQGRQHFHSGAIEP
jgi:BirA family biotin operon repressor/biotin-[acetyl-CoA-carboxylase] ligase